MQDAGLFNRQLRKLDIDSEAKLSVLRGDEKMEITVALERTRIAPAEARKDRNRDFEMTVREITFFDRDDNRWSVDTKGVIVEMVEDAGWASLGGLESDDLIQQINGKPIKGLKSYRREMKKISEEQPKRVVFVVLRGASTRFQFVEPEWKPRLDDEKKADAN